MQHPVICQDPDHADHLLIPMVCGHLDSVFNRSSILDFMDDGGSCGICGTQVPFTPEAISEVQNAPWGVDACEQFLIDLAATGLDGECLVHEGDCNLLSDECVEVERTPQDEHEILAGLIVRAREILGGMNL